MKWINAHGHFKLSGFGEYYQCKWGSSQIIKYIFLCFRQAQGRLEIVGRGSLKIYSANEDDTGTYTCRAENLLDSVDSDISLVVLGKY